VEEPDEHDDFCSQRFNVTEQEGNRIRDLFESHFNLFKPSLARNPAPELPMKFNQWEF